MKKLYALAALLLAVLACAPAWAEGTSGGFTYELLPDGTASITDCSLTGDVVIPASIDGHKVTNLASQLFYGAFGVTSVRVPATVTYFGSDPDDNMWDYVFSYCYTLRAIEVDAGNPTFASVDGVLYSKDMSTLINYPCDRPGAAYHVPAGVEYLCCTSFASSQNLEHLFLEDADTWWFTYTFYNTGALTTYYQTGGDTERKVQAEIDGKRAQPYDTSRCAFMSVPELERSEGTLRLPDGLVRIEDEAFAGSDAVYVLIPPTCRTVGRRAFEGCDKLRYVRVPQNAAIAEDAFTGCPDAVFDRVGSGK